MNLMKTHESIEIHKSPGIHDILDTYDYENIELT